jgi:DNA-damage-inducible protein J
MSVVQIATRVDETDYRQFETVSKQIGTTPANALRMFVSAFNQAGGFPYQPQVATPTVEAFCDEQEATNFASSLAQKVINETR